VPFIFDDVDRPVGVVESLLLEARGSRSDAEGRSLLGHARLDDSPEANRAWAAIRTGDIVGVRLAIGDLRTEDGDLARGHELHAVALLRKHRGHQAELKLRNGAAYRDLGLVFAKEPVDRRRQDTLGDPIQVNHLDREFKKLARAAGLRPIKLHGLQRLGHRSIAITRGVYAHALPAMQQDAAAKLGALLHGDG
jgi:integrase